MRRRWRNLLRFVLMLIFLSLGAIYLMFQLRYAPMIKRAATLRVENEAAGIINDAIIAAIEDGAVDYRTLVTMDHTDDNITVIKTNMAQVNLLKFRILDAVGEKLQECASEKITLPVGSVLLPEFLAGEGPSISIRMLTLRASNAKFDSQFSEAGINQTRHQITVTVSVDVTVMTPAGTLEVPVQTNAVVAETIIIGSVPKAVINGG